MPIYEYECLDKQGCGKIFEHFAKSTTDVLTECECCGAPVRRLMSPVNSNFSEYAAVKKREIAYALSDDDNVVDPKKLPNRPFREI